MWEYLLCRTVETKDRFKAWNIFDAISPAEILKPGNADSGFHQQEMEYKKEMALLPLGSCSLVSQRTIMFNLRHYLSFNKKENHEVCSVLLSS